MFVCSMEKVTQRNQKKKKITKKNKTFNGKRHNGLITQINES